jgi:hypothetical protein
MQSRTTYQHAQSATAFAGFIRLTKSEKFFNSAFARVQRLGIKRRLARQSVRERNPVQFQMNGVESHRLYRRGS